ncbi:MAG TPA: maleylpyruvate isomerase family mycothiol-dependent enzyme [Jatrophihabitans sp.]|nr:maleylpyruvate isomerase family mycothiol-dependent enzyme [Jatrophihabitans sp.]
MELASLIGQLTAEGQLLIDAARRAGWDAQVPAMEWTVRELVTHVGGVHRWAADIVTSARDAGDTAAGEAVGSGPGDDELAEWFENGHAALVETLRSAPDDLTCFTFLPAESPRQFWARRQAHETAIHRVDAQGAAGMDITPASPAFAQDGIGEILNGFARRRANAIAVAATLGLDAADGPSWLVRFGGERIESEQTEDLVGTDVTLRGLSSDLYYWLWNRPSAAVIDGDGSVAARWAGAVRVRWS